jgi:RimJ/RimL family protein N-acetyltransferase
VPQTVEDVDTIPTLFSPVEISAGALHLRPWVAADADDVFDACQDTAIQRWTNIPAPYRREDAYRWVAEQAPGAWRDCSGAPFAVLDSTSGRLVASVGLNVVTSDGFAEIGFWCAPDARGRGVVTKAVGAVARWAFDAVSVNRLEWRAEVGNWASRRVAEKAGFQIEGVLRSGLVLRQRRVDAWIGALLPDDPPPVAA